MSDLAPPISLPPYKVERRMTALAQTVDYSHAMLGIDGLWKKTTGKGILGAVLDTGRSNHPDLAGAFVPDAIDVGYGIWDNQGHGTHCAGIIGARNNDRGVVGVAPDCLLLAIKMLSDSGSGDGDVGTAAIHAAIDRKVDFISMSWGGRSNDARQKAAIDRALAAGIICLAAAGNEGPGLDTVGNPAGYEGVYSVGSVDRRKQISRFSSRGKRVDIVAFGDQILSTYLNGDYAELSGTSMATPQAAGVVALILSARKQAGYPKLTPAQLLELLKATSIDLGPAGPDTSYGYGLIDPAKLLDLALPKPDKPSLPPLLKVFDLGPDDLSISGLAKLRAMFGGDGAVTIRTK